GACAAYVVWSASESVTRADGVLRPVPPSVARTTVGGENYLVIGSDSRQGPNGAYGDVEGARSDTTMLAHVARDESRVTFVSLPRDSWVDVPACLRGDGTVSEPYRGMLNSAYATGGAACAVDTVQRLTGLRVDHYVEFDFAGFSAVVDALGGVDLAAPDGRAVSDPDSGLEMGAGVNHLDGERALAYVRARHNLGDGSDLGRVERQQRFVAAVAHSAATADKLLDPVVVVDLVKAVAEHTTLDTGTRLTELVGLARAVSTGSAQLVLTTAPIATPDYDPEHDEMHGGGRVLLDAEAGDALYHALAQDLPVG
ncbi:MAG: LCP family protein, partial [Umezawaea sp.]